MRSLAISSAVAARSFHVSLIATSVVVGGGGDNQRNARVVRAFERRQLSRLAIAAAAAAAATAAVATLTHTRTHAHIRARAYRHRALKMHIKSI